MPYEDERAGLAAIREIAASGIVDEFRVNLVGRHTGEPLPLPNFMPCPPGKSRTHILAIDGSSIYAPIPGALPCTEAGLVTLGMVVMDLEKLRALRHLPESGAVDPRQLRETEKGQTLCVMLPGRNAARKDGLDPRTWFRQTVNDELEKASLGGETFAETLRHLLGDNPTANCPNIDCNAHVRIPEPNAQAGCISCGEPLYLSDGLRIHEQFSENLSVAESHSRVRDTLEIIALINTLRYLIKSEKGRIAITNTAFVMDGQLAAFGTIAVLARAVRIELRKIQEILKEEYPEANLVVMSGVKTGVFVDHVAEIDRAPEPGKRIPHNHFWLPDNAYIRANIVAKGSANSKPWGNVTHYGRPVILKTATGQCLVLNIAQPEAAFGTNDAPPLTDASAPKALPDALATAAPLGVGSNQFLALRRAHAQAAIPLRAGTDLINSLSP